ncbi:MAG: fibronectin type III domain-containing protein [bacterium]|nr:fibronectin type III domain-containing protein [bacterium]
MFARKTYVVLGCTLFVLLLIIGCDRYVDTRDPVSSLPTPPPTPVNLSAIIDTTSVTLSWEVIDTTAVRRFRIYTTDSMTGVTRLRDSTTDISFTRTLSGLRLNQAYAFQVASVGATGAEGYRSEAIIISLQVLGITIDNNAIYTRDWDVSVNMVAPSTTTNVMLSEDPGFAGAVWQTFAASRTFKLSDGEGSKRVYARFLLAGGIETGGLLTDSIIVDSRAFIDSVYFTPTSGTIQTGTEMFFYLKTSDVGGAAAVNIDNDSLRLFDDGTNGDATAADGLFSYRWIVPLNASANEAQVLGRYVDAAGNRAPNLPSLSLLTILSDPPDPVILAATDAAGDTVRVTWSVSRIDDFTEYRLYRQLGNGTVDENDQLVTVISQQNTNQFSDVVSGAGTWLYRIFVVDANNQSVGSNTVTVVK